MLFPPNPVLDNSLHSSSLISYRSQVPDPRINRRQEPLLTDARVIAVCTLWCAGQSFNDLEAFGKAQGQWFKTFLGLPNGIPSHDPFNRVFAALDPRPFLDGLLRWTQSLRQAVAQEMAALDGKALGRARNGDQGAKRRVSAWAESNGLGLAQLKVADKSNEITAGPPLLRVLELTRNPKLKWPRCRKVLEQK
jgi:hypothetical protein